MVLLSRFVHAQTNNLPRTNFYQYNLEISNTTMPNPDGSGGKRPVMLINNQYPGPVIRAKWGDWIVVNVKNNLQHVSAYLVPYCLCL
jgi:FtsP/CotA-like multicopper oxidase with cupredoxin domain